MYSSRDRGLCRNIVKNLIGISSTLMERLIADFSIDFPMARQRYAQTASLPLNVELAMPAYWPLSIINPLRQFPRFQSGLAVKFFEQQIHDFECV